MVIMKILVLLSLILQCIAMDYPFNNPKLSWTERVEDLVNRLTVDEMTLQMANGGRLTYAPAIDRLGIKPYPWGTECLRGDVQAGSATSFPQAIGLSASFSKQVVFDVARATGLEVRAKYNNYSSHGNYGQHTGASCWSPVINIMRDPRWGRNQETYGEDPYMSGALSQAFVYGLQGNDSRYIMTNAGCKHFDVYAGPENIPESRHSFNAKVTEYDWRMTFLPAFKACVEAGSYSLMCSYNAVNGIPACANKKLLTDILRGEWGFDGYVISDEGAIEDIMDNHKYTDNIADTAAAAVNAGCNLEDGPEGTKPYFLGISDAVKQNKITEAALRDAVKPLFYTRMRLGLFDPVDSNPYAKLDPANVVQSADHRELAITAAVRTFVMLKNVDNFLPLKYQTNNLSIVGPMANNTDGIFGGYAPQPDPRYVKTPLQSLSFFGFITRYSAGCKNSDTKCDDYDADELKAAVRGAGLVFVCLGTGFNIESESNDRSDIQLPGKQLQLLQDVVDSGAPVILLLFNAGPLDISWAKSNPNVKAIIACWFPAQGTGDALVRVISGTSPAGRLPATWPMSIDQVPPITDYTMVNRTYRYFTSKPLYPFGYGLSYSKFDYRSVDARPSIVRYGEDLEVDVFVNNVGTIAAEEVVQLYVEWMNATLPTPQRQLVGFERVTVTPALGTTVSFKVKREQLAIWSDSTSSFTVLPGKYRLYAGGQQPNQADDVGSNVLTTYFSIV